MNMKSFLAAAVSTVGILTLSSPASAVIYDWQFTNEDGNIGDPTDIVAGFVEFNDADVTPGATGVAATNLQITSVTENPNPPINGRLIELDDNLVSSSNKFNSFNFDSSGLINQVNFNARRFTGNSSASETENLILRSDSSSSFSYLRAVSDPFGGFSDFQSVSLSDGNSNTLAFSSNSASVPFEFSPTLGLVLAGSFFAGSRWLKYRFK